jgi:tRNA (guanine37-N1)-methyltransferase
MRAGPVRDVGWEIQVRVYVALLHYPVYNRSGHVVCSAITNLDIHDIARAARTYGVSGFYVITPLEEQQLLLDRLLRHWREGYGARSNPHRKAALELVTVAASLPEALALVTREVGMEPELWGTGAATTGPILTYSEARERIHQGRPAVILFGTGWGLSREVLRIATCLLPPIHGATSYNHLSVRGAAAVILDRLLGQAS